MIRSNNEAVCAVADLWHGMVRTIKEYQHAGRGLLYMRVGDEFMSYMDITELEDGVGKDHLDIDPELHEQLVELVKFGYDFDREFVFVTRQEEPDGTTKFIANKGSLAEDGWREYNTPEHIKKVEQDRQKIIARARVLQMKQLRQGGKKAGKSKAKR